MRSKLPESRRETVNPFKEEVRERDWSNKLKGKVYVDEKRGAVSKSIDIGDEVLLRVEKSSKLSSNFRLSPFKVIRKTGSEVSVESDTGIEFKHDVTFVKKYHAQEDVSNNEDNRGSESTCAGAGVAEDQVSSDTEGNKEDEWVDVGNMESEIRQQQEIIRRSTRQVRRPVRFNDFVME